MYKILFIVFIFNSFFLPAQGIGIGERIDMTDKLDLDKNSGQFAQIFVPDDYDKEENLYKTRTAPEEWEFSDDEEMEAGFDTIEKFEDENQND